MRVGQKGRLCRRWWSRGRRPPGRQDQRFEWTCVFGAARPDGEAAFGLVLPEVGTQAMQVFLDAFAATTPEEEHAVMVLDRAGWHGAKALEVPSNVTLVPLRPTPLNSTPSNASGSGSANASSACASSRTSTPSSTPAATLGTPSPTTPPASALCAFSHGSRKSSVKPGGMTSTVLRPGATEVPGPDDR